MKTELTNNLNAICLEFTKKFETYFSNVPIGTCYLIGHCIAEGFKRAGYFAEEITGTAILKDKNGGNIIYGKSNMKGKNIGYYHTWSLIEIDGESIIIDPSVKYNKVAMRNIYGIKPNPKITDFVITNENSTWLLMYLKDDTLAHLSKNWLNKLNPELVELLTIYVMELVITHLSEIKKTA
jgi:hypothetical protein